MAKAYSIELTPEEWETLASVFHEYKDVYRGDKEMVLPAMAIEEKLVKQTEGLYYPDTTYDIK